MSQFFQTLEKTIERLFERQATATGLHNLYFVISDWESPFISVGIWPCAINPKGRWPSQSMGANENDAQTQQSPRINSVRLGHVDINVSDKLPSEQLSDSAAYPGDGIQSCFTLFEHVNLPFRKKRDYQTPQRKLYNALKRCNKMPPNNRRAVHVSATFFVSWCELGTDGEPCTMHYSYADATLLQYYDPSSVAPTEISLNEHLLQTIPVL